MIVMLAAVEPRTRRSCPRVRFETAGPDGVSRVSRRRPRLVLLWQNAFTQRVDDAVQFRPCEDGLAFEERDVGT